MPDVRVLGVHRLDLSEKLVREVAESHADEDGPAEEWTAALERAREELAQVVLVEIVVDNPGNKFDVYDLAQPGSDQRAWLVVRLSDDGARIVDDSPRTFPDEPAVRLAFFLHFFDPNKPLLTSAGEVGCPDVTGMPGRLSKLHPFEPVD
jgi:hypothetical protein